MKYQLIMIPNQPILVSDENIETLKDGQTYYDGEGNFRKWNTGNCYSLSSKKIIAGIPELPSIYFSALSEEDCKKIGLVDVDEEWDKYYTKYYDGDYISFVDGFKAAQSLNEKKFTKAEMRLCYMAGWNRGKENKTTEMNNYIEFVSQPKVFDVEVEMEEICLICKCQPVQSGCAYAACGAAGSEIQPKIISNNSIKITKLL